MLSSLPGAGIWSFETMDDDACLTSLMKTAFISTVFIAQAMLIPDYYFGLRNDLVVGS